MAFATGVAKRVSITEETTFGVNPVTGGQYLRRVSSDLALDKDSYESQEILVSQQLEDARHGVRRPAGTFAGQLSPGSFTHFWQGLCRNAFAATPPIALTFTLDIVAGTLTCAGGLAAAGLRLEDIFQLSGVPAPNAVLNGINLRTNGLTDTVITTRDLPLTGLTSGALTGASLTVVGMKVIMPPIGQLYKSYSIEHWFSDAGISELFTGCRFGQTAIALPATGLVTFNTQIMGQDMTQALSQQITAPAPANTTSALAAVNGKLSYNNADLAIITGLNLQIAPVLEAPAVLGSNTVPWIFQGRMRVSGSFTALFQDETLANTFINEQEVAISTYLTMGSLANAAFMRLTLPRVKAMSARKSDGETSLVQSFNFTAMRNNSNPLADQTTLVIQDSTVP